MKYSLVNGIRKEAIVSGEKGICIFCNTRTIAHCGKIKINHWKHITLQDCDSWYENETEWHRNWKNHFPSEYQEVIKYDNISNEKHIADIYNPKLKLTIEFQHSPITPEEIEARENFYKKMIWVVDLFPYKKNIILHKDIETAFFEKMVMKFAYHWDREIAKFKRKENKEMVKRMLNSKWEDIYIDKFQKKYNSYSNRDNYYLLEWKYPHKRWKKNTAPVFFDLNDNFIYLNIETIKIWHGFLVKRFEKSQFIEKYRK